ncbi:uncharacterized protein LY79DRAFT_354133 [Colletotrichum navitas]|uniref:Uncharacterized protein n=1 Tax=Colletotrichum navitas TaxID=681940 RepID=A0AAD8V985_9PEZI|nr:uncharacterized protein LY79DRAFT_354133 [Colletotrichum navitas]KAK1597709.1 hypothetical protein LY79DRAFT_354133 [Colletotrichum navitas]
MVASELSFCLGQDVGQNTPGAPLSYHEILPLDFCSKIYGYKRNFEGINYLSSLSNSANKYHAKLVFKPNPKQPVKIIYISENHLSVKMIFCTCRDCPEINKSQDL